MSIDLITVVHNKTNYELSVNLMKAIQRLEDPDTWMAYCIDNRTFNRGFAKACNEGASLGDQPYIGFINPDTVVKGPFIDKVEHILEQPNVVITGERFGKPDYELKIWGCLDWVCGASFFVRRDYFESAGGFDEQFVMYFEETDMIRRAQDAGKVVRSIRLPLSHKSPDWDSPEDVQYKRFHFNRSGRLFREKWS